MYLALARKYRPQKFADLIGQPHITKTLQNAIRMDKLYSSLIFSGMKGVGKTSAARILSKALNCEKGPAAEPCNQCSICAEITEDNSPDYIEIDGASNNGVEEVRSLKETVKYKPFKNRFRVVVIDEVHMLSNSAWNALLKTIEEPPEHTYFVMATTDFHKIPATIVSRCQQFEFKRIPQEIIVKLLHEICAKEDIKITEYSLFLIAKASEGSLRDAKKILDQAYAISSGDVNDQDVVQILGVIEESIFISLTKDVFSKNRKGIIQQINDLSERGMDLRFFYNEYLKFFRDLMVLKSLEDSQRLHNLNPENIPALMEMLKNLREVELLRYFNAAKDLEQTMRNTENPRIILEYLFLKLSYFPSLMSIDELLQRSGGSAPAAKTPPEFHHDGAPEPPPVPLPGSMPGSAPKSAPSGTDNPVEVWIETIAREQPRLANSLKSAAVNFTGNTLTVKFPGDMEFAYKNSLNSGEYLKDTLTRIAKRDVDIQVTIEENGKTQTDARVKELENDPRITTLAEKIQLKLNGVQKV